MYKMYTNSDEQVSFFPDISFLFFTICAFCFLKSDSKSEIKIARIENKEKNKKKFDFDKHYEIYSFLLKDILKAPRIQRVPSDSSIESYDGGMPIFHEMLNPRRRSFSGDDINSLNLINDYRLTEPFERALTERTLTPCTELSSYSHSSWENLSLHDGY